MVPRLPLIVILGSTGSGKTKLSLDIARKFGGEIISADSMQVYTGLDIITAKATKQERELVPHHLIDVVDPSKEFTVLDFRDKAVKIIENLLNTNRLPIVVGGTNYYIEALVWKLLVDPPSAKPPKKSPDAAKRPRLDGLDKLTGPELHSRLELEDPEMATRIHPNNKRKIIRSLEVLRQHGKRHSDILREQHSAEGASNVSGPMRFPNSLVFWLCCDQATLDWRLDARVDSMLQQGLVKELTDFHARYNAQRLLDGTEPDYTKGIFQSIGFKEFHKYLILNEDERCCENGEKLLQRGIEDLKMVTRRYARKQIKWVRHRFLGRPNRQTPPVFNLDTTNIEKWDTEVTGKAFEIIDDILTGVESRHKPLPFLISANTEANAEQRTYRCEICERVFIGELQWDAHRKSRKHQKMVQKKKAKENDKEKCVHPEENSFKE